MNTDKEKKAIFDALAKPVMNELDKAVKDALIYGNGFVMVDNQGSLKHIPAEAVIIDYEKLEGES